MQRLGLSTLTVGSRSILKSVTMSQISNANDSLAPSGEDRFRLVIEASPSGMIMVDESGCIVLVNSQVEKLFGYSREELLGKSIDVLVPATSREAHPGHRAAFFGDPKTRSMGVGRDLYAQRKDGTQIPVEIGLNPLVTEGERFVLASIVDITERKRSEQRLRQVVEAAPSGMIMVDETGKIVLVNSQVERLFGYSREELLGQSIDMLVPSETRVKHPDHRAAFFADPKARAMGVGRDLYGQCKNGAQVPVEIGLNPLMTEGERFVLASIVDITERKRSEERLRLVVEAAPSGMIMVDETGKIVLVNSQVERLFGYTREELLGQSIDMLVPSVVREKHPGHRNAFFVDPKARAMGIGRDLYGQRKDGAQVPVEIGLNPLMTEGERFVLASIVDITERKRSEEALLKAKEDLEVRVKERTVELVSVNEELEHLAYVVSHELQAPISTISRYCKLLTVRYKDRLGDDANEFITKINYASGLVARMIDDLWTFARIAKPDLPQELVNMTGVLEESVAALKDKVGENEVTHGDLPLILGNKDQLVFLFKELINNGIRYRSAAPPRIHITAQPEGDGWLFSVSDNGIGIDRVFSEDVFRLFHRLSGGPGPEATGTGLSMCRKIVQRHGGRIWFESQHSEGTTVFFWLPKSAKNT
jgi:PAS domain S-box-containing protein